MKYYLIFLMYGLGIGSAMAQHPNPQPSAEKAMQLCHCINDQFDRFHPYIKEMVMDFSLTNEDVASRILESKIEKLSEQEQARVWKDVEKFSEQATQKKLDHCLEKFLDINATTQEWLDYLENDTNAKKCQLIIILTRAAITQQTSRSDQK